MIKKTLQYKITEKDQGKTVEQFLRSKGYSHRLVVKLRNSPTGLTIGGELAFTIHRLQAGEILIATLEEENSQNIVPVELPLNIVYEDEDILVVNKDAGVPIHPSQGHFDHTLANAVAWYYQSKGQTLVYRAINRLDRDTTGLLVIAKHLLAGCILSDQMLNRQLSAEKQKKSASLMPPLDGLKTLPSFAVLTLNMVRQPGPVTACSLMMKKRIFPISALN